MENPNAALALCIELIERQNKQAQVTGRMVNALVTISALLADELAKSGALDKAQLAAKIRERAEATPADLGGAEHDAILGSFAAILAGGKWTASLAAVEIPEWLRAKAQA